MCSLMVLEGVYRRKVKYNRKKYLFDRDCTLPAEN